METREQQGQDAASAERAARGFAAMNRERQREIARKGGKAAHAKGVAHEYTTDEARDAGRKGGQIIGANRRHMAEIGRLGGLAKRRNKAGEAAGPAPQEQSHPGAEALADGTPSSDRQPNPGEMATE